MTADRARPRIDWGVCLLLALVTFIAFLPALQNDFVNWDDDRNFLDNPDYRGLGPAQLKWMWTTTHMGHYMPLTWMTLGLDYRLWGLDASGYHLTSLLLHVANVVLFYFLAVRLLRTATPSRAGEGELGLRLAGALAALLFGVHPLRVESVAWVTERRDVVSGLFYLSAILAYLRACEPAAERETGQERWYWGALGLFALALLSKSMVVTLPLILLLLDVYPLRRLGGGPGRWVGRAVWRVWLEKVPFLVLGLIGGVLAVLRGISGQLLASTETVGLWKRAAITSYGLAFYVWKMVTPVNLSPLYELVPDRGDPRAWSFLLTGAAVLTTTLVFVLFRRRYPALLATWVAYAVTLFPVSGLLQNGPQIAADRFTYLSCLAWAILGGGGALACWRSWAHWPGRKAPALAMAGVAVLAIVALGFLTWKQVQVWRDPVTLWTHAVATNPGPMAHENLGVALAEVGDLPEAVGHFEEALRLNPDSHIAHIDWGVVSARQGKADEAIRHFRQALRLKPDYDVAHGNLGLALMNQGEIPEAIEHLQLAVRINPNNGKARDNLAKALALKPKPIEPRLEPANGDPAQPRSMTAVTPSP